MEEIREVPHFENGVEHKILITYVIAKVSYSDLNLNQDKATSCRQYK